MTTPESVPSMQVGLDTVTKAASISFAPRLRRSEAINLPEVDRHDDWELICQRRDEYVEIFKESKDSQDVGRTLQGPCLPAINDLLERLNVLDTHQEIPKAVIFPTVYQERETEHLLSALKYNDAPKFHEIMETKKAKHQAIDEYVDLHLQDFMRQQGPLTDLLEAPRYSKQQSARTCAAATFQMVIDNIARLQPVGDAFTRAVSKAYGVHIVGNEEYIKFLTSEAFARLSDANTSVITFTGADLDFISNLTHKIKTARPQSRIYCITALLSEDNSYVENYEAYGIWHSNVLLDVGGTDVVVHDPKHGPNRKLPKEDFFKRWMQAYGYGHLIISERVEST